MNKTKVLAKVKALMEQKEELVKNRKLGKKALGVRFPILKKPLLEIKIKHNQIRNLLNPFLTKSYQEEYLPCIVYRHQSLLMRKLGDSNPRLQRQKVKNLEVAIKSLDKIIIQPGEIFSLWNCLGRPTRSKGYVKGMLLSQGKVVEGLAGGLCQLSNFLYWLFLHSPVEIVERHHHSKDVFPDSGRVLPFGSGATIMYNLLDLKVKNTSQTPLQLKIWLTDKHLKGQLLSQTKISEKYHILQDNHCFLKTKSYEHPYYRYNELYREMLVEGKVKSKELITTNLAPVYYPVNQEYLERNQYKLLETEGENP